MLSWCSKHQNNHNHNIHTRNQHTHTNKYKFENKKKIEQYKKHAGTPLISLHEMVKSD